MSKSRSRLAADWFAKLQVNTTTQEVEHEDVLAERVASDAAISDLVSAAPATLDTLNELAAALGDDANFATTVTNSIGTKAPQATTYTKSETDSAISSVVSSVAATASKATNGYFKDTSTGLIIQWGKYGSYGGGFNAGNLTITFPIAFPSACVNVNMSIQSSYVSGAAPVYFSVQSWGSSNFSMPYYPQGFTWIAIGY